MSLQHQCEAMAAVLQRLVAAYDDIGGWLRRWFSEHPRSAVDHIWARITARSSGVRGHALRYVASPEKLERDLSHFPGICRQTPGVPFMYERT